MAKNKQPAETIDWSLTTWDGAGREALRRWAELPLERIIAALEEMQELSSLLAVPTATDDPTTRQDTDDSSYRVHEPHGEHTGVADRMPLPDQAVGQGTTGIGDVHTRPDHADTDLAALDEQALLTCLREHGDRAPRDLIDACASRNAAMVQAISELLDDAAFWNETVDDDEWWLRLHAAMILGLIPGEQAGRVLIDLMRRLDDVDDRNMQDWLAGNWPALFANKPATLSHELRALAEDRAHAGYMRINAVESYLEFARHDSETALDTALDWVASLTAAEDEDWYFRLNLGSTLLDFPRERHRQVLERLAARQQGFGVQFTAKDIKHAYALGHEKPDWERFKDPWAFYQADAIVARQARWDEEDLHPDGGDEYEADRIEVEWPGMHVRPCPKVGRNDPCPCGSGKKYKKCCLDKAPR